MSHVSPQYWVALSRELTLTCDISGIITWADQRAHSLLGIEAGASLLDVMVADSRDKCCRLLEHAVENRVDGWELVLRSRGELATFECSGMPHQGEVLIVATRLAAAYERTVADMGTMVGDLARLQRETLRQQREIERVSARLERERHLLEAVLHQLPSGVVVLDAQSGRVVLANEQVGAILSTSTEPMPTLPQAFRLSGAPYTMSDWPIYRSIATGEAIQDEEIEIERPEGERRYVRVSSSPVRQGDTIVAGVATYQDITDLKRLQAQLEHDSLHDHLTGLPNRRLFLLRLTHALADAPRRERDVAVLFIDLDGFKTINDTFGHQAGDTVLAVTGDRLRSLIRAGDTAARLAGDEFTVLLEGVPNASAALAVADRIRSVCAMPIEVGEKMVVVTPSLGLALSDRDTPDAEMLIKQADTAMYQAKRSKDGRVHLFNRDALMIREGVLSG